MSGVSRVRPPGVPVDGEEIRRVRLEAGLSLAAVAGDDLSRTAVHRIEQGTLRPSMRTLQVIAGRLGQPVQRFLLAQQPPESREALEAEILLARVERLVIRGELAQALAMIAERLPGATSKQEAARLCCLAARCHLRSSRPLDAVGYARRARAAFEELGDQRMAVESMAYETRALGMEEDRSALETGQEALRRCQLLDPVPPELEALVLTTLAGIHLTRHDWSRALAAYESATAVAQVRDLEQVGQIYDGLSLAYQGMGDLQSAMRYAYKALDLSAMRQNQLSLARTENNLGLLLMRMERWGEAETYLRRSLERCEDAGITTGRCHVLLSLGQLRLQQGDAAGAERAMAEAAEVAEASRELMTLAQARQWLGKLYATSGRDRDADRCFLSAISLLAELGAAQRLADCHSSYAQALSDRGDLQNAVAHWRAAAQIWHPAVDEAHMMHDLGDWEQAVPPA